MNDGHRILGDRRRGEIGEKLRRGSEEIERINALSAEFFNGSIDYDEIYDSLEGWMAYAKQADTYNLRKKIIAQFESIFDQEISSKEISRHLKHLK